jgi:hypothetical protein
VKEPDPLEDARALLVLARLIYRARSAAALYGVQPARAAARAMVPLGKRLAVAVEQLEASNTEFERAAAVQAVVAAGEELAASIDEQWEGLGRVLGEAIRGVKGETPRAP